MKKNDIALIRLVDRIWFTELIHPACLQTNTRDEDIKVDLFVTGWGQTTENRNLMKTNKQKFSNTKTFNLLHSIKHIVHRMNCSKQI